MKAKRTFFHSRLTIFRGSLRLSSLSTCGQKIFRDELEVSILIFSSFFMEKFKSLVFYSLVFWVDNFLCLFALVLRPTVSDPFCRKTCSNEILEDTTRCFIDKRHHFLVYNANDRRTVAFYFGTWRPQKGFFRMSYGKDDKKKGSAEFELILVWRTYLKYITKCFNQRLQ